jgi:hypothetical protein
MAWISGPAAPRWRKLGSRFAARALCVRLSYIIAPLARGMDVLERAGGDGSSWGRVAAVRALCAVERKVLLATRGKADEDFRETSQFVAWFVAGLVVHRDS